VRDDEPPSKAECATMSPRVWQATVDADLDVVEPMRMQSMRTTVVEVDADGIGAAERAMMPTRT
jgi:hypothetical protein